VTFTAVKASKLEQVTPPSTQPTAATGTPMWVWFALGGGGATMLLLSIAVWKLARRRPARPAS
jgi:hypothetical protein